MQSPCISRISPAIAGTSQILNHDSKRCNDDFNSVIQRCPQHPDDITPTELAQMKAKIDDKVLCQLMCCCSNHPSIGSQAETNQRQKCVEATLLAADKKLNHQSRYKAEVSYNMDVDPPSPFMHRDAYGQNTTERSTHWQTRAKQEIPGFKPNKGKVRRPDIIIVKDPSKPPYQDNIDRVVEMKFKKDKFGEGQERAYEVIAGDKKNLTLMAEGVHCVCSDDDGQQQSVSQPLTRSEEDVSVDWGAVAETAGMAVVTAVAAVATVALVAVFVDGPAGEIAAGTGTAAAAARTAAAFDRVFKAVPP